MTKAQELADDLRTCGIGTGIVYVPNGLALQVAAELLRLDAENAQLRDAPATQGQPLWTPAEFAAALAASRPIGA